MKKLITIFFLLLTSKIFATNYYVSATGSNGSAGTSTGSAWQTIVKVNSFGSGFVDGDSLLFKCGDTFYGGIIFNRAVKVGWYGTGAKPIITGLSTISSWTNLGGNIWEANTSGVKATNNLVLRDGLPQQVGRYPNANAASSGYLTNTATSSTTITGPALSSVTNWTGAQVAYRLNRWTIEQRTVTAHSAGVITFAAASSTPLSGFGYFFQRDSRTLDQDGEWWQDGINNKLRMYFGNNNPSAYTVEASTVDTLLTGPSNVSVDGIMFKGAGKNALGFAGRSGIAVKNCDIYNSGEEAIFLWFCTNATITNNTVINGLGGGIRVYSTSNVATKVNHNIVSNTVKNSGNIAGMEKSSQNSAGIQVMAGNTVNILYNSVTNSGYNGIEFYGDTVKVKYNFVDTSCTTRDDGGGIYTWVVSSGEPPTVNHDRWVVSNTVLHSLGQNNGTNSTTFETSAQGIYLDGASRYVIVDSNTVGYVNGNGFHGNGNTNNYLRYNTFFNCNNSTSFQRFAGSNPMTNIVVTKNIISPYRFKYSNASINSPSTTFNAAILAMGTLDSNYYSLRTATNTSLRTVTTNADGSGYAENNRAFSYITGTIGQETHSTNFANTGVLYTNPSASSLVLNFPGYKKTIPQGNNYNNSYTIPAWSSVILIDNGFSPPTNNIIYGIWRN